MYLLTINAGSSSIKVDLFRYKSLKHVQNIKIDRVKNHEKALKQAIEKLQLEDIKQILVVAHRVVHGGEKYTEPTVITKYTEKGIESHAPLAPLHNPINLKVIRIAKKLFHCPHFAVFDTSFHSTIPEKAYLYGLPYKYYQKDGVRKYGFHGTNHKYMYEQTLKRSTKKKLNVITCHLGNGVSVTAIKQGKVIDTSMGFTPLEGAIMGTRSGSIDPAIPFYLKKRYGRLDTEKMLQEKSGLLGLSEISSDMRDIHEKAKQKNQKALRTIEAYSYSIAKYIAMYVTLLGKVDYIVFSGGIGENAGYIRRKIMSNLKSLPKSVKPIVIEANEAYQMAKEVKDKLKD